MAKKSDTNRINRKKRTIENVTFDGLLRELRNLFRDTDSIEVIIQALINIDAIDNSGNCSEKAKLLLDTIISNKIKKSII